MRLRQDAHWEDRNKDRAEIAKLESEKGVLEAKRAGDAEMITQLKRENETLLDELAHQRAQFALLENLAKK